MRQPAGAETGSGFVDGGDSCAGLRACEWSFWHLRREGRTKMNKKLKYVLCNPEQILACIFIIITTILVLMNVFLRYFMNTGLYWSEEVATSCFVWSVFLGAASGYRHGMHIGVDMLVNKLPRILRNIVKILVDLILTSVNGYIFYLSIIFISMSYQKPTAVLGVSSAYVSSALLVGFGLITIYSIGYLYKDVRAIITTGTFLTGKEEV